MNPILDAAAGRLLARYVLKGLMTLEDLDAPSPGWDRIEADRRHANRRAQRLGLAPTYPPPQPWRNLAREWIDSHPREWESMVREALAAEAIEHPDICQP